MESFSATCSLVKPIYPSGGNCKWPSAGSKIAVKFAAAASSTDSSANNLPCRLRSNPCAPLASCSPRGETITLSAADPLNLVGILVPGERVPAISGKIVSFRDGVAVDQPDTQPSAQPSAAAG